MSVKTLMTRAEAEEFVKPIVRNCLRDFGDLSSPDATDEDFDAATRATLRPDIRRISLILSLAQEFLSDEPGEGLEVGCGYGYLLLPMAQTFPQIHWTGAELPGRTYFSRDDYRARLRASNCDLIGLNLTAEPLPFPDNYFSVLTFSETLEHLPVERVNFVLTQMARVLRPGGLLFASSPNQASLENRLLLLRGKSVFDLPDYMAVAHGSYGHIRLYTPAEAARHFAKFGFVLERTVLESNNSANRGSGPNSIHSRLYRFYERVEENFSLVRRLGDTWYSVFRKAV
jgi:SAM-dependent methyltransferase